jgi:hypothetical protein
LRWIDLEFRSEQAHFKPKRRSLIARHARKREARLAGNEMHGIFHAQVEPAAEEPHALDEVLLWSRHEADPDGIVVGRSEDPVPQPSFDKGGSPD